MGIKAIDAEGWSVTPKVYFYVSNLSKAHTPYKKKMCQLPAFLYQKDLCFLNLITEFMT